MLEPLESRILLALSVSIENGQLRIVGTAQADTISVTADEQQLSVSLNNTLFAVPLIEVQRIRIDSGSGNDRVTIDGAVGIPCTLRGGAGNDSLRGGSAACRLQGDAGHDTLVGSSAKDAFIGGAGIDTVDYSSRTDGLQISLDGKANDGRPPRGKTPGEADNIAADMENIIGGSGNDILTGNRLGNTLQGGAGDDTLAGGEGNDLLVGGTGSDVLQGGGGDDIFLAIDANLNDTLDGGDGFDTAAFDNSGAVRDILLDVESEV